ncbi:DNA polymerase-3 subunit alpha [Thermonema lapsum]|uniref:DNA polymerase III subunit alpha n=1 Tax=Thermonema lapsum TaxID=28195 RepID=A0A846MM52_9BACT|nr:DNA polymerase III subunit alpha [Thermonema lapsum]NIK72608.1 DNA polymerase-3 subunit alpha [Thermonema lapsum]
MPDIIPFIHLHCHTQFSLLDGATRIEDMMRKAKEDGMKAVALTDHGNMFGAFKFVAEAHKQGVKPIVGCEFYLVEDRFKKQFSREEKDVRYHQLLLAKNPEGYKNLSKLCSLGFIEGYYSKYPRIDKELIRKYHKGLIATSCCIGAEIPQTILRQGEAAAEEKLKWWIDVFGDDFYIELQRHHLENIDGTGISQEDINQTLLRWAKKYNLKVIATNDSHYLDQDDWNAHDILLCINTGAKQSDPKGEGKGMRFAFPNNEFYFKTQAEMNRLFADVPQALDFTNEIYDKVETLQLKRDILMPHFPIPPGFKNQDEYLRHLTFEGAKRRYDTITPEIEERINYELNVIQNMGFSGYFLIVQDFIAAARKLGVSVGPGRGSAAGSVVAYCTGITNIDPIRYNLLFERFLNPERVSMPDIDVDFDDEGRQRVIDYVVEKYGRNQVAHIITYGTMAAKMAVRDVGRVLELPLQETDALAKLIPDKPGTKLQQAIEETPELKEIYQSNDLKAKVLREALVLEGSVRSRGVHAAGIIIAPGDLTDYIPVCTAQDTDLLVTQFDGKVIEDAGMLKMDFLGLKTLTIIKDALAMIKKNKGIDIDIDHIPLDDAKTFELYQRGETIGTFQFESEGMQMYLRQLKPTNIEDLIAMNALYRPGPLQFIPVYIRRKHGKEAVEYPHPLLEPILRDTFGIMVYQEQIMQAAQVLAGYTLGGADLLRRAMGKKKKEEMDKQRATFVKGCKEKNNIPEDKANEIFDIMAKFAEYGFNRSHSAAYSVVAYQTAYLKANYPAEYMAAVLTHNMSNIDKINFFLAECRRMGLDVLGPDVNQSDVHFVAVNDKEIRFGLAAIKGVGEAAVRSIIEERNQNGAFSDIFDFVRRVNLSQVNKKIMEGLALAGAFDCFGLDRSQYFHEEEGQIYIEKLLRYASAYQAEKLKAQQSIFGNMQGDVALPPPKAPRCEPWGAVHKLKKEKEVVGFYLSGHPLDMYEMEVKHLCNKRLDELADYRPTNGQHSELIRIAGVVTEVTRRQAKNGNPFMIFTIEDFHGSLQIALFGKDYAQFMPYVDSGQLLYIEGEMRLRYNSQDQWEFRPKKMEFLSELRKQAWKGVRLLIDLENFDPDTLPELEKLAQDYAGDKWMEVHLFDPKKQISVGTLSQKYKLSVSKRLLESLNRLPGIKAQPVH